MIPRVLCSRTWIDENLKLDPVADNSAIRLIRQIESAITQAHAGRTPNPDDWGEITAKDFLRVVRDVSVFMMTNFSDAYLPPIGLMEVSQFKKLAPRGSFRTQAASQPAWKGDDQVTFLAQSPSVAYTRSILFWVREILHAKSGRSWIKHEDRQSRVRRQARILERQCSQGLEWLSERMALWPERYRDTWWTGARLVGIPA